MKSLLDRSGQVPGTKDKVIVLGDRKRNPGDVDLLEAILANRSPGYLASYGYYGRGIHVSVGNSGH